MILKNYDLTKLNTFGISARAKFFSEIENEKDFLELVKNPEFKNNEKLFLGGGSNILFTKDFDGIVILNKIKGIEILDENAENVWIKVMGGENWNNFVNFAVENGYWGIENLSSVPGTVGASPVQNIGAYGVEIKDVLESVEAVDIENGDPSMFGASKKIFSNKECEFGYRDSVFKNKLKGKYFITAVVFKLSKKFSPNIEYKVLKDCLEKNKIEIKNSKDVSKIVSEIRQSKLPDPKILGNSGSFFKNVYVNAEKLEELKLKYPEIPFFEDLASDKANTGEVKIPAGWFIEKCGWKGKRIGNVGVYEKQALILVNYGGATGQEIKNLSDQIIDSVSKKFGITLAPEVNFV